jgi:hypothetical protein
MLLILRHSANFSMASIQCVCVCARTRGCVRERKGHLCQISYCSCRWCETTSLNCGLQRGLLFISQVTYEHQEPWWNNTDGKTEELKRQTCPSATMSITNCTWTDLGVNPGLHSERPVTDHLSHVHGVSHLLVNIKIIGNILATR